MTIQPGLHGGIWQLKNGWVFSKILHKIDVKLIGWSLLVSALKIMVTQVLRQSSEMKHMSKELLKRFASGVIIMRERRSGWGSSGLVDWCESSRVSIATTVLGVTLRFHIAVGEYRDVRCEDGRQSEIVLHGTLHICWSNEWGGREISLLSAHQ